MSYLKLIRVFTASKHLRFLRSLVVKFLSHVNIRKNEFNLPRLLKILIEIDPWLGISNSKRITDEHIYVFSLQDGENYIFEN